MGYLIRAPDDVVREVGGLPRDKARRLRVHLHGIADLAENHPPVDPIWLELASRGSPLFSFELDGMRVLYEVDQQARLINVVDVALHAS